MFEGNVYMVFIILCSVSDNFHCQNCNLGRINKKNTSISTVYVYENLDGKPILSASKALDGEYYNHSANCAGSLPTGDHEEAWWQITMNSISKITKVNLVFRENYTRHFGYYVFVTNNTVEVNDLTRLNPVYHDQYTENEISQQNTIVFPGGLFGRQLYLYVSVSNPTNDNSAVIEPCEVEIYGCVLGMDNFNCTCNSTEDVLAKTYPVLWDSEVIFKTGRLSLRCNMYFLSVMNLTGGNESQLKHIMQICDGKQQCTINSCDALQSESISFYCTDRCLNEDYNNSYFLYNMAEDSIVPYESDERGFTAFGKSRVLNCSDRYVLTTGNLTLQCQMGGRWNSTAPVCNITCQEPRHENSTTIRNTFPSALYFKDYNVSYACRKNHYQANGSLVRVCNSSGDWTGEEPICKRCQCPCYRLKSQHFITDPKELQNRIDEMQKELEIDQKTLAATVRKKNCAKDERKSSAVIGSALGVGIIAFVLSIIFCSDIPILYRHLRYGPDAVHRN